MEQASFFTTVHESVPTPIFCILLQKKGNVPLLLRCLEKRGSSVNSKRHVVRQRVAPAKVVVAWREKKGQICQQAVTSVGQTPL